MSDMALEYELREFTVDEYHRMAQVGILAADERVELLEGRLVRMSPIGHRHWVVHMRIVSYLNEVLRGRPIVGQGSFPLGKRNEPQPDIAILAGTPDVYLQRPPEAHEILVVLELAESSLAKDTGPKLTLYARFGIPDYLVVDIERNLLLHYTEPNEVGYGAQESLTIAQTFHLRSFPTVELAAGMFLMPGHDDS